MTKIIKRSVSNWTEKEKEEQFKAIYIQPNFTDSEYVQLTCSKCNDSFFLKKGVDATVICQKCGNNQFTSTTKFVLTCKECGSKEIAKDEIFNTNHCKAVLWKPE